MADDTASHHGHCNNNANAGNPPNLVPDPTAAAAGAKLEPAQPNALIGIQMHQGTAAGGAAMNTANQQPDTDLAILIVPGTGPLTTL